jgi:hypothetical protein
MFARTRGALGCATSNDVGVEQIIWSAGREAELQRIEQRLRTRYPSAYTNTHGITFADGVDPDGNRVLITYPTPE